MKFLKHMPLVLMILIGITGFAQPGSYYPPPSNIDYHNDTLTIFPPDSLPGEPVVMLGYNIYVDSVFYDNVFVTDPVDTIDFIPDFTTLPPGNHVFCVFAVYNEWISDSACDTAIVIYGNDLPFLEDWSSVNFEEQQWISSSGNWVISSSEGNPLPAAEFRRDPVQTDYTISLESYPINATGMTEGNIWLDYSVKLDAIQAGGHEKLQVQVWNWVSQVWTTVHEHSNAEGSFAWNSRHINIKSKAMNKVFKVRFQATGINSSDIHGWFVDNIHIYRNCIGPFELLLEEELTCNQLYWQEPEGCYFDTRIHWDDGVNAGNSIGTGEAVEFDVAARWTPAQLVSYADANIYDIAFFPAEYAATYHVRVWTGEGPDTMIVDQPVPSPVIGQWNYVTLTTPMPLDVTQDLWVGYYVNTTTGYPAGVDDGPAINGYGNMINFGGWQTLLEINPELDYNWNIACRLVGDYYGGDLNFNIYRQTNNEEFQLYDNTTEVQYTDNNIILSDHFCYMVTMIWMKDGDTCESSPTNTVCEEINIGTGELGQDKTIRIYPNPANNWLNIESEEEINIVRLYNLLGEEVRKLEIGNLDDQIDVSHLPGGVYYVTVETAKRDFKAKIVILR